MEREFFLQHFAGRSMGLVFIRGGDRSSWRHKLTLAAVRSCQSIAVGGRALPGHNAFDQNAKEQISVCDFSAPLLHVRGHVFCAKINHTRRRLQKARQKIDEGGLTRAVGSDQRVPRTFRKLQ